MGRRFYFVTEAMGRTSIYLLRCSEAGISLSEKLASGGDAGTFLFGSIRNVPVHAFYMSEGNLAFLFEPTGGIVCSLIGIFPTFGEAIDCWVSHGLEPNDVRWRAATNALWKDVYHGGIQVAQTFIKDPDHANVLRMRRRNG